MATTTPPLRSCWLIAALGEADHPSPRMSDPLVAAALEERAPTLRQCHLVPSRHEHRLLEHWTALGDRLGLPVGSVQYVLACRGEDSVARVLQRLRTLLVLLAAETATADLSVVEVFAAVVHGLVKSDHRIGALFRPSARQVLLAEAHRPWALPAAPAGPSLLDG